jgi:dienelactone hydrolase
VVDGLRNETPYQFRIEANRSDRTIAASPLATATPRVRPGCAALDYIPPPPRVSFFCTKAALDEYLSARGIDPLTLRCRQQAVTAWTTEIPDCHYVTPHGEHLLLLRSADSTFAAGDGYPSAAAVRQHARRAIWGRDDPFQRAADRTPALTPLARPIVGNVTRQATARSFTVPSVRGAASTVTWFAPARSIPGRFSIYHEGHGGAGVDIGADVIDWLLERGWQVIAMDMPVLGVNRAAARPGLESHADLQSLDDGIVSPIEQFLLPVKSVVDAIMTTAAGSDPEVLLIGRSGGGWTTYLYAAVDARIDIAVSIAGGRPISARLDAPWGAAELGDYEQSVPHLYNVTSHEDLMLAAGSKAAFYVYNRWDGCCFRVEPDDAFVRYLRRAASASDKAVTVFVDRHHRGHSMSPRAFDEFEWFLTRVLTPRLP